MVSRRVVSAHDTIIGHDGLPRSIAGPGQNGVFRRRLSCAAPAEGRFVPGGAHPSGRSPTARAPARNGYAARLTRGWQQVPGAGVPAARRDGHRAASRVVASVSSSQSAYWLAVQPWTSHSMRPTSGLARVQTIWAARLTGTRSFARLARRCTMVRM
jgi:hypothetical protein